MSRSIAEALSKVDWSKNVALTLSSHNLSDTLEECCLKLAVWSRQFEDTDRNNPALCFVRGMQVYAQQSVALIALCMYNSSAATMRALLESSLYYSFFRTHQEELATLARAGKFYLSKREIIDYHLTHTSGFKDHQKAFDLSNRLETWYSEISRIIHGQVPGAWIGMSELSNVNYNNKLHSTSVESFAAVVGLVNDLFLITAGRRLWPSFAPDAKTFLTKGLSGSARTLLGLDQR